MRTSRFPSATLLLLLAVALAPSPAGAQLPPDFTAAWQEATRQWEAESEAAGIVGGSMAFLRGDSLVRLTPRGMADLDPSRPVDANTIYHWASITKTFTAISIMQLRDRGLLSLDDPIVKYVPELRDVHNPYGSMEDITLRQLLSHSAGFRDATWPWDRGERWEPYEPTEWSQLVAMMPYTEILFPPGSKFSYSNPGIIFLGRVIEKVTGDVYEAYVAKNIFRPLGMTRAYFDNTPWGLLPHRSNNYVLRDGTPEAGGLDFNTGITVSNGGLNAPIPDMARYFAFLLGHPPAGADGDGILKRSSLEEMWHTVVPIGDSDLGRESMGLCFFLYDDGAHHLVGHTGTQKAFLSFFVLDPSAGVGVVAVSNTIDASDGGAGARAILDHARAAVVKGVFPLFRPGERAGDDHGSQEGP
ncbi:MAG: serine hydrolase domain-containing protein [Gemmatimonadota bacterium]